MSDKELQELLKAIKKVQRKHTATPEKARKFLEDAGIYTASGELAEPYR